MKLAFENDFEYLPRYFVFDEEYFESYKKFSIFFGSIALGFAAALAIFFLIKFLLNRFRSTKVIRARAEPLTKQFRNITLGLFIIGSAAFIVNYGLILGFTFDIK